MYIGDLDDPSFSWDGGNWNGNVPRGISPEFPPTVGHYNQLFHDWVRSTNVESKQTDFGGWVAIVSKHQIRAFIDFCYQKDPSNTDPERMLDGEGRGYLVDRLNDLRDFVESLDDDRQYALVAAEL